MILNKTSNPFDAEPLTDEERDYLARCGFLFPPGSLILKTPVRIEVWQPDGDKTFFPIKNINLDTLEQTINFYKAQMEE